MDEQKIRRIIRDEIQRNQKSSRFNGVTSVVDHVHNGADSPKLKAENIIPSCSIVGSITMSTEGQTYTLNLNSSFTPQLVICHSNVYNTSGEIYRGVYFGVAQLTPSFYFQPESSSSVSTGDIQYPFPTEQRNGSLPSVPAQSSSGLLVSRSSDSNKFSTKAKTI